MPLLHTTFQRHRTSWLTDPPPASDARSSKRYRPSFPAFDKGLLSDANARLSINTFSEFLQFTTYHILLFRYLDLQEHIEKWRERLKKLQSLLYTSTELHISAESTSKLALMHMLEKLEFNGNIKQKLQKNPSSYLNALMLRLTSPATEFDEDAQPPLTLYSNTGNPSAIKTLSNIRATACRNVATAVLHSHTRKPTSHISRPSLNSLLCFDSLVLRWQLWNWWVGLWPSAGMWFTWPNHQCQCPIS